MNTTPTSEAATGDNVPLALTDGYTVIATADIAMPPAKVFQALTEATEIEDWWGSADSYRMTQWKSDFRVGGRYSVEVRRSNGEVLPASGKFLEIDAPRRLVHTRVYDWDHPTIGWQETTIAYDFYPITAGTRLVVRHDGFAGNLAAADEHAAGWKRVLGWLGIYAEPDRVSASIAAFNAELGGSAKPFALLARIQVKDGTQQRFESAFASAGRATRKDKGVIAYDLSREPREATHYIVYERWDSLMDLEAHLRTAHITTLFSVIDEVLAGVPDFHVFIPVATASAADERD